VNELLNKARGGSFYIAKPPERMNQGNAPTTDQNKPPSFIMILVPEDNDQKDQVNVSATTTLSPETRDEDENGEY
jgi:hypothetical protein